MVLKGKGPRELKGAHFLVYFFRRVQNAQDLLCFTGKHSTYKGFPFPI